MDIRKMAAKPRGTKRAPTVNAGAHGSIKLFLLKFRSKMLWIVQEVFAFFVSCCPPTLAIVWARNCFTLAAAVSRPSAMAFTY